MNKPPRDNHFVSQFWIRHFTWTDGKVWAYDWDRDKVEVRSPKPLMMLFNLYTVDPAGADDTSLETGEMSKVDTDGAIAFKQVIQGDRAHGAKEALATFL